MKSKIIFFFILVLGLAVELIGCKEEDPIQTGSTGGGTGSNASCGATNVHNPNLTYGSMTDQDGNVYKTIVIGTQEWMAENLKTSHYRNGDLIPYVWDSLQWPSLSTGAYCLYRNNATAYKCPYGCLYNWSAVADSRNICPTNWHVPSDLEWTTLISYLGGDMVAGTKMKSNGTQYWLNPNNAADNSSGFSGLPGGGRNLNFGQYFSMGTQGYWWSSTESSTSQAWYRSLISTNGNANRWYLGKKSGVCVRCLRD